MIVYCENCGELSHWSSISGIKLEDKKCSKCNNKLKLAIYDTVKQRYFAGPLKKTGKN